MDHDHDHGHGGHMDGPTMAPNGTNGMNSHGMMTDGTGGGHGNHGNHDPSSMDHMMQMYFHCSSTATVLFEKWTVSSAGAWFGTCLAIFLMAMMYEGLKVLRETLLKRSVVDVRHQSMEVSKDSRMVLTETHQTGQSRLWSWGHMLQSVLHMVQVTISYFLMLIFMTYNVYLCIPVIIGAGFGYFVFGWKRSIIVDVNEHCH